jgi:hypothetical protein
VLLLTVVGRLGLGSSALSLASLIGNGLSFHWGIGVSSWSATALPRAGNST